MVVFRVWLQSEEASGFMYVFKFIKQLGAVCTLFNVSPCVSPGTVCDWVLLPRSVCKNSRLLKRHFEQSSLGKVT